MDASMKGKVVVVTGAGGRLGQHIVPLLAKQGAHIAALVLTPGEAETIPFPKDAEGWAFEADLTDEAAVTARFREIKEKFGRVDVLIHTVGGWNMKPFLDTTVEDWRSMMDLNLTTAFLCFREAARAMGDSGGRLIGITSSQGADRGMAQQGAYSAAKAGVVRLVEAVGDELMGSGITAHAIAPSMILFGEEADESGVHARDIARLCLYLCTDAGAALNTSTLRSYGTRL
jgi:3-oxoacyl-[acyl-carrier protein] reductase